jgi:hypothetical protein
MLLPDLHDLGSVRRPLAGLVLAFGEAGPSAQPCEQAWVGVSSIPKLKTPTVTVYVSPFAFKRMSKVYAPLGRHIILEPLLFTEEELDTEMVLLFMTRGMRDSASSYAKVIRVSVSTCNTVLFVHTSFQSTLLELADNFTWSGFGALLDEKKKILGTAQLTELEDRYSSLKAFVNKSDSKRPCPSARFAPGQLTIVDLSDRTFDVGSLYGLFEMAIYLFKRAQIGTGKVLVVDDMHQVSTSNANLCSAC